MLIMFLEYVIDLLVFLTSIIIVLLILQISSSNAICISNCILTKLQGIIFPF